MSILSHFFQWKKQWSLSKHHKVVELKLIAKDLQKKQQISKFQARQKAACQWGFKGWSHFIDYIKQLQWNLPPSLSASPSYIPSQYGLTILGYEINSNHYLLGRELEHFLVCGEKFYTKYDSFLFKQAVQTYQGAVFVNSCRETVSELYDWVNNSNARREVRYFNFSNSEEKIYGKIRDMGHKLTSAIIMHFLPKHIPGREINLIELLLRQILPLLMKVYPQAMVTDIARVFSWNSLVIYHRNNPQSKEVLSAYFQCLHEQTQQRSDITMRQYHQRVLNHLVEICQALSQTGIFSDDERDIHLRELCDGRVYMFDIYHENPVIEHFLSHLVNMAIHESALETCRTAQTHKVPSRTCVVYRQVQLPLSFLPFFHQASVCGVSVVLSYSGLAKAHEKVCSFSAIASRIATKIIDGCPSDSPTMAFLNFLLKHQESFQTPKESANHEYAWLIHQSWQGQIRMCPP